MTSNKRFAFARHGDVTNAHCPQSKNMEAADSNREEKDCSNVPVTFVEFYAGIGGWSMALAQAFDRCAPPVRRLERLAALDHSDLCLKVLEHNSPSKERKTVSIERLTLQQVQEWNSTIWAMSPPCQVSLESNQLDCEACQCHHDQCCLTYAALSAPHAPT
jgi:hypothetical protein